MHKMCAINKGEFFFMTQYSRKSRKRFLLNQEKKEGRKICRTAALRIMDVCCDVCDLKIVLKY